MDEAQTTEHFNILAKFPDQKQFLKLGSGQLTRLNIHAIIFRGRERAEAVLAEMMTHHPEAEWKIKQIS